MRRKNVWTAFVAVVLMFVVFCSSAQAQTPVASLGMGAGYSELLFEGVPVGPFPFPGYPEVEGSPLEFLSIERDYIRDWTGAVINYNWAQLKAQVFVKDDTRIQLKGNGNVDFGSVQIVGPRDALGVRTIDVRRGQRFTVYLYDTLIQGGSYASTQRGYPDDYFMPEPEGFYPEAAWDTVEVTEWGFVLSLWAAPDWSWYEYTVHPVGEPWNLLYHQTPNGTVNNW